MHNDNVLLNVSTRSGMNPDLKRRNDLVDAGLESIDYYFSKCSVYGVAKCDDAKID